MDRVINEVAQSLLRVSDGSIAQAKQLPSNVQEAYRQFLTLSDGDYTADHKRVGSGSVPIETRTIGLRSG